ncbi:MAG: molybdopterin-dependent oxidoreductase [Acidobacteriota bacterium]|nr:molybdopterin-dependent oxidoreductase [Acidobacteriota bacterium]
MADIAGSNGQRTEFRAVGRANVPGRLSYTIATGRAKFGSDYVLPDMLHAAFLRNPHGRAKIKSMDISKAKALEGVVDIVTWDDPEIIAMKGTREPLIPDESDTENEEIGAVVVAVSPEICEEALRRIKVEWEVFPTIVDPRDAFKPGGTFVRVDPKGSKVKPFIMGDVETAFKEADHVVEFDWTQSLTASHPPNPNGSLSWWDQEYLKEEGKTLFIEGVCPTWGSFQLLPMYNLTFDRLYRGTTFQGGKYCDWMIRRAALITPLLSKRTGRPVRCMNIRQNDFYTANPQRYMHTKIGFRKDGTITGVYETQIGDSGAPGKGARSFDFGAYEGMSSPFNTTRCTNMKYESQSAFTSSGKVTGSQTSPFNWDSMTIAEQIVAEKLGMDPIDVALRNVHGPVDDPNGIPPSLKMCVEKGKKAMNWNWHPAGTRKLPDGRLHGLSFRYAQSPRHAQQPYTATVTVQADNKVYVPLKGPWMGVYAADACALVVAEEMGARIEDVHLLYDNKAIFTPVGGGSDGTTASAWVMKEAAVACRKALLELASLKFKCRPEDLDTKDTKVFPKSDPSNAIPFGQFIADEGFGDHDLDITATFFGRPPETTWHKMGKILDVMNASFCEVAVDPETGGVEVTKFVVVCDPGKVLRMTSFEGQLHQAMFFSQGGGLSEEWIYDKSTGVKLSTNMWEYKKPTILDFGPIETGLVETRSGNACYGASGISHCMAAPLLPVCAVANAIGHWIAPPVTPDKILKALGKA